MEPREALLRDVEQFEPEQVDAILQAPRLNLPMPGTPPCVQEYLEKVALRLQSIPGFLVNRKAKESKDQRRVNRESGWVCCGCGFVSTMQSPSRLLRHIIGEVSVDMWKTFHDGAKPSDEDLKRIKAIREKGFRSKACPSTEAAVDQQTCLAWARDGLVQARDYCQFRGWTWKAESAPADGVLQRGPAKWTLEQNTAAQEDHVLAIAQTSASFRSAAHVQWRRLFDRLSEGAYTPPSRTAVKDIVARLHAKVQELKPQAFVSDGPWNLLHDGASGSNGEVMLNFLVLGLGQVIHLESRDAGWVRKSGQRAKEWLKQKMLHVGLGNICAIVTDGGSNMRSAWALLAADADVQAAGVQFCWCAERVANLLPGDVQKLFPWTAACEKEVSAITGYFRKKKMARAWWQGQLLQAHRPLAQAGPAPLR